MAHIPPASRYTVKTRSGSDYIVDGPDDSMLYTVRKRARDCTLDVGFSYDRPYEGRHYRVWTRYTSDSAAYLDTSRVVSVVELRGR